MNGSDLVRKSTSVDIDEAKDMEAIDTAGLEESTISSVRPRIIVSACLGFDRCRWNDEIIHDPQVERLADHVDFLPICPECEIGLGVPRAPVRLVMPEKLEKEEQVGEAPKIRLVQPRTGLDCTQAMCDFIDAFIGRIGDVDGLLLKFRSPSCGPGDVKIYREADKPEVVMRGSGIFASAVKQRFESVPVEDEGRLKNYTIREHFLSSIFLLARFREVKRLAAMKWLVDFHAAHKFMLLALNQESLRLLGRITANHEKLPIEQVLKAYEHVLHAALRKPPSTAAQINSMEHMFGFFSRRIGRDERLYFLDLLEEFRRGAMPLSVPIGILKSWALRFEEQYLLHQQIFEPFPTALEDPSDSAAHKRSAK